MRRILFVDDELFVLEALQRMMYGMRNEWEMRFANGGVEALKMMAESPAEVVVSDMRMPEINGAQLLNEIMHLYPKTVRLILSGFADMETVMQCVNGTHQFLAKPCGGDLLRNVIGRALEMDAWMNNSELKSLVSRLGTLPGVPTLYFQILNELNSSEATVDKVAAMIAQDPGMTAKMLQLVNSAFFGMRQKLTDPTEAVLQLGLETVKSLVLGLHVFSQLQPKMISEFSAEKLWHHSLTTATKARRIAQLHRFRLYSGDQDAALGGTLPQDAPLECGGKGTVEESFTAGLLHDIGRLVLVANLPEQYLEACNRAIAEGIELVEAEQATFGASHAEVGGYLLGLWGLPISLVEAAVFHHYPSRCQIKAFTPLTTVHIANALAQEGGATGKAFSPPKMDQDYLTEIGVWNRIPSWRDAVANSAISQPKP